MTRSEADSLITSRCRACDHAPLLPVLSLGNQPPANRLRSEANPNEPEPKYPLDLFFCPSCSLVQIDVTLPPEELFSQYPYFSSFSDTMVRHAQTLAERIIAERQLTGRHRVIEIASNDGYLLQHYLRRNVPVIGIEPAANVAEAAQTLREIPTIVAFFGKVLGEKMAREGYTADVLHAHNVLAHVADLHGFVDGAASVLAEHGVWVIEVPYLFDLLDRVEFDTIYHEHLCYFSLTALDKLFRQHHLRVSNVERIAIHGGTLRLWVEHDQAENKSKPSAAVHQLLAEEAARGVLRYETYQSFAQRVAQLRETLRQLLADLKQQGKRIAAYGASAKGSTLLHYCGIGAETIDFVADRSSVKQGRFTPGTGLPIVAPERLVLDRPDYVLLLTWNFCEEILAQQVEYRLLGGKFIVPIPEPIIV